MTIVRFATGLFLIIFFGALAGFTADDRFVLQFNWKAGIAMAALMSAACWINATLASRRKKIAELTLPRSAPSSDTKERLE